MRGPERDGQPIQFQFRSRADSCGVSIDERRPSPLLGFNCTGPRSQKGRPDEVRVRLLA